MILSVLLATTLLAAPTPRPVDPLARLEVRLRAGEWDALRAELERALPTASGARRAALLVALGLVESEASSYHRHDPQKAESAVMRAAEAARAEGDALTRAWARVLEGRLRYGQGFADPPRWDEAQRILDDAREQAGEAKDLARAEAHHRRSVALREKARATASLPFALTALAGVLVERGRRPEAAALLRRAAEEGTRSGSHRGEASALLALQPLLAADGDTRGAREASARALAAARAYDDPELVAEAERAATPPR